MMASETFEINTGMDVNGNKNLQLPLLPDPGKQDDILIPTEKFEFTVRLGTSLARGLACDERKVRKQLSKKELTPTNVAQGKSNSLTPSPTTSRRPTPSPRNFEEDKVFRFPASSDVNQVLARKSSRQNIHDLSRQESQTTRKFSRLESRDGGQYARRESRTDRDMQRESRKDSRRASILRQATMMHTYITDRETIRAKLLRVFNNVRIISGVCLALKKYVQMYQSKTWSFMEMYFHVKEDLNRLVVFNPQNFARIEPESGKLKKLLAIPKCERTAEHVKVILALMRGNKSFQDYPSHVQIQLSLCMEYQSYEARRVILKQGHRPEAFYIIISGQVIANIEEKSPTTGRNYIRTVHELGPGDTFGEIALIDGGRRTASIVCKTNVELLVILRDDFNNIIRGPLLRQIEEHVGFCKSLPLFRDFPCEKLRENPSHFFYLYFKKSDIVVRDSKESKHIIVVKAGKCTVVSSFEEERPVSRKAESAKDMEEAFPHYDEMQKMTQLKRRPKSEGDRLKETICMGLLTGTIDKTRLADHGPDVQPQRPKSVNEEAIRQRPPLKKSKTMSNFYDRVDNDRRQELTTEDSIKEAVGGHFWAERLHTSPADGRKKGQEYPISGKISPLRSARKRASNPFYTPKKKIFAQIAELKAGDVFGLESLVQKPSTTMSLVSEGAECIFVSKRLFLNLANLKVLKVVTDMVQLYPSRDFIEEQVRNYRNWNKYKSGLVQAVLNKQR